jgi:hypothetical protein
MLKVAFLWRRSVICTHTGLELLSGRHGHFCVHVESNLWWQNQVILSLPINIVIGLVSNVDLPVVEALESPMLAWCCYAILL